MAEAKKKSLIGKLWESVINAAVLGPRAILATTTCAGQLLRNFLATDVNWGQSLKYNQSIKNRGKKLTYALSAPVTAFSPKLKQKRGKLDKVPGPKERSKDMIRYDYAWRTMGRGLKYESQIGIDAWLLWSEGIESMLYLDKTSPMYVGPWPTIKQKGKNLLKSFVMPLEPLYRRSQNKLWLFGGKKKAKEKTSEEKKPEEKKPEVKKEEVKKEAIVPQSGEPKVEAKKEVIVAQTVEPKKTIEKPKEDLNAESDMFQKKIKEKDDAFIDKELADRGYGPGGDLATEKKTIQSEKKEKATSISEIEKQRKKEAMDKDRAEIEAKKRKHQKPEDKENLKKEFGKLLENNFTEAWVVARGKKHNKGKNLEEILRKLDKENITFATFIDDEILAKSTKN